MFDDRYESSPLVPKNTREAPSEVNLLGIKEGVIKRISDEISIAFASEERGGADLAQRSIQYGEDQEIEDIKFSQNGAVQTLKTLIPGQYAVIIGNIQPNSLSSSAYYDTRTNSVHIPAFNPQEKNQYHNEGEYNMTILHEAGHSKEHARNAEYYRDLDRRKLIIILRQYALKTVLHNKQPDFSDLKGDLMNERNLFSEDDFVNAQKDFADFCIEIRDRSNSERSSTLTALYKGQDIIESQAALRQEGDAWVEAIRAFGIAQRDGVNLYMGTPASLYAFICRKLNTYKVFN